MAVHMRSYEKHHGRALRSCCPPLVAAVPNERLGRDSAWGLRGACFHVGTRVHDTPRHRGRSQRAIATGWLPVPSLRVLPGAQYEITWEWEAG